MSAAKVTTLNLRDEYARVKEIVQKARTFNSGSEPWFEANKELRVLVKPGYYIHHKSSAQKVMRYVVFGITEDTETPGEYAVTYFAQYKPFAGFLASRPLIGSINGKRKRGFLEPVGPDNAEPENLKPRFAFERKLEPHFVKSLQKAGMKFF